MTLAISLFTVGCSKDKDAPKPVASPIGTGVGVMGPDTITLELSGGASFNQWNYSTNGQVTNTFNGRVTVILQTGQFVQANGSFMQLYTNPGNQPVYPWIAIKAYSGGNQQYLYTITNNNETVSHTYTNN